MKILGVPIVFGNSFLLWHFLISFLAWGWGFSEGPFIQILTVVLANLYFLVLVLFHEFGHVLAGRFFGKSARRIIINAMGGFTDLSTFPKTPKEQFWTTLAGPLFSFWMGGLLLALAKFTHVISGSGGLTKVTLIFAALNVFVGIFNLLPVFPLDGGRILLSIVWKFKGDLQKAIPLAIAVSRIFLIAFVILAILGYMTGILAVWDLFITGFLGAYFWRIQTLALENPPPT